MNSHDPNGGQRRRRTASTQAPMHSEPSMSAPSPMPGKPAASYMPSQPPAPVPQADWQPPQEAVPTWRTAPQRPSGYTGYPVQQGYQPPPSQGIPGGQLPPRQYDWRQGYTAQQEDYRQPTGRGWSQPYPAVRQPDNQVWQGGYAAGPWSPNGYTPYEEMPPAGDGGGGSGGNLSRSTLLKLIATAVVVVIAVAVVIGLISQQNQTRNLRAAVDAYSDRYNQGVYVDGIHLGGMTREEARAEVLKSAQLKCDEWHVQLLTGAGEYVGEINSYHLGMTVHVDDALNEAWLQGHSGATYEERMAEMEALLVTPFHTSTALPSGDQAAVDRILGEIAASVYVPATDASIATFTPYATNPFEIVQESYGRYLNVESIKAEVYDMVSRMESGVVSVEPTILYPAVTAEDLRRQTTLIGSHYTMISSTSTENRNKNIERACELIRGTVIAPGETFSFNRVVGPRTKKTGFYPAIEYAYGKQVEGYGGGVCQVSSTIYVAAVRANMEIVRRTQHALEVGYTVFGLDATVNLDGKVIDFEFRNNTAGNIYIVTKVMLNPRIDKNHYLVICEIYGPALEEGVTYDLVATQVEVPIPEPTVVPDKKAEHATYTNEAVTIPGKIGYEVDSYKVKYVNGEEVERTHMYHDTYEPVQPVTYVGVSEPPLPTGTPVIE